MCTVRSSEPETMCFPFVEIVTESTGLSCHLSGSPSTLPVSRGHTVPSSKPEAMRVCPSRLHGEYYSFIASEWLAKRTAGLCVSRMHGAVAWAKSDVCPICRDCHEKHCFVSSERVTNRMAGLHLTKE